MKFKDYPYEHLDEKELHARFEQIEAELKDAGDYKAFYEAFQKLDRLDRHIQTMSSLCNVRHTMTRKTSFTRKKTTITTISFPLCKTIWCRLSKRYGQARFLKN